MLTINGSFKDLRPRIVSSPETAPPRPELNRCPGIKLVMLLFVDTAPTLVTKEVESYPSTILLDNTTSCAETNVPNKNSKLAIERNVFFNTGEHLKISIA
jgi:hypothetical protein